MLLSRRLSPLILFVTVLAMTATLVFVLAAPGGLRNGRGGRSNKNNDNDERRKTRAGGLSDREEKIAEAMEREYYRLHPMNEMDVEDEYERLLL
jgi:hypothetical protein